MTENIRQENVKFYKGKRVLITGHTGYKGALMTAVLNFMGADTMGYALAPKPECFYEKIGGDELIHSITGNLLDSSLLEQTVQEFQPEIVFHFAASADTEECLKDPVYTYQTNVMGSTFLLEALRKCPSVKSIVLESINQQSTDENSSVACSVGKTLRSADIYSSSKICMEYMARDYNELYFQTDSRTAGISAVRMKNTLAADGDMRTGTNLPVQYVVEESDGGGHRLLLSEQQPVLDMLDGYLTISRLLYEKPAAYAGEWEMVLIPGSETGKPYEKDALQPEKDAGRRTDREAERENCMRIISEYYRK